MPFGEPVRLKKHLGQHLLVSGGVIKKIVEYAQIEAGDKVVEIGPGTGNLTKALLETPLSELHLVEIDKQMVEKLKQLQDPRLHIHHADATSFDFCLLGKDLKVLGNLPYNVASLILERIVFCKECINFGLFMVQKEVAQKLIEGPSWLGSFIQTFYRIEYLMSVPPKFFVPPPKVTSALIRLTREEKAKIEDLEDYKGFLLKLYSQGRKMLKNKLDVSILERAGIDPKRRTEELSLEEIIRLYHEYHP
ncbi:16S rRNA (adenine(1518)-N(6)/adenine(1519)-N(6))-dimethyltransferase RsmA [Thermocrinis minervae]|uniref:Ribosomal RNA small subunit methyltransferase A n=1 Tax=Thermocrinis minervae TaxID=381751 RepID=A0A1M6R440_9AQUI|nr:16S rRNA (adenine(1518)-N(6)/adenine(1519)-N(6))-dimethyltransferase RsmA [Thermocrinis minervae]SHK27222.1 16S rRNA (adenine1518-N6/adenine1519-N6)-dimethyltransferase [Thermocrinis minervae]